MSGLLLALLLALGSLTGPPHHQHQLPSQVTPSVYNWEDPGGWSKPVTGPLHTRECDESDNSTANEINHACTGNS